MCHFSIRNDIKSLDKMFISAENVSTDFQILAHKTRIKLEVLCPKIKY